MLLVDTADQNAILDALKFPGVQGFTTNPTLIARAAGAEALSLDEYVAAARKLCGMSADDRRNSAADDSGGWKSQTTR